MNSSALTYLACPVCKGDLNTDSHEPRIETGLLKCGKCGRDYPVIRGIPRLLPDSLITYLASQIPDDFAKFTFAFPLAQRSDRKDFETDDFLTKQKSTMDAFSFEWNKFTEFSLEFTRNEYVRTFAPKEPGIVRNKVLLEAGTGAGIFLHWFNHFGASHIFGMNLGLDVETAVKTASGYPNITIVEGDIFNLPFKDKLDFVVSHGVVHHLPDPEGGFKKLVSVLKPGGEIFIWVYGKDLVVPVIEFFRAAFRKLPKPLVKFICIFFALPLLFFKLVYLFFKAVPFLRGLAPKVPYNQYAVRNFREMHCTIMDKIFVPVVNYYDKGDMEAWFSKAGLGTVSISSRDGNSWSCYGIKANSKL